MQRCLIDNGNGFTLKDLIKKGQRIKEMVTCEKIICIIY